MSASVATEERKKLLSDVWLFHGATDEELTMLAELAYEVTVGPHVDIVNENEFGDELFLVVDGHAAVTRNGIDLGVLNAGDFFGEMALLGTGVRTSTVRSIVAMTLLGLRAGALRRRARVRPHGGPARAQRGGEAPRKCRPPPGRPRGSQPLGLTFERVVVRAARLAGVGRCLLPPMYSRPGARSMSS